MGSLALLSSFFIHCERSHEKKAELCLRIGDYQRSIRFFNAALEAKPGSFRARKGLGTALMRQASLFEQEERVETEHWHKAIWSFEHALALREDSEIKSQLGYCCNRLAKQLWNKADSSGALRASMKSVLYQPNDPQILNYAGILNNRMGEREKAHDLFAKAAEIDTVDATAAFNLGMFHWQDGKTLKAYEWWLKALMMAPKDENVQYWFARADLKMRGKALK